MHKFKPKMQGGDMSPEAHKEWEDKGGKHVSGPPYSSIKGMSGKGKEIGMVGKGQDGKMAGAPMAKHEADQIKKGDAAPSKSGFAPKGGTSSGMKSGPMKHAGADMGPHKADGSIKGEAPKPKKGSAVARPMYKGGKVKC